MSTKRTGRITIDRRLALKVAQGLIDIAKLAMPDTYFASDSRVAAARTLLKKLRAKPHTKRTT